MTFTLYIALGLIFGLMVEWIYRNLNMDASVKLENWMRLVYVIFWPLALIVFLDAYFNTKNKEK